MEIKIGDVTYANIKSFVHKGDPFKITTGEVSKCEALLFALAAIDRLVVVVERLDKRTKELEQLNDNMH